ncbi:glycosyltransferase family 9 protein [Phenylobacterium aquaticum]|uniref:glycosyltransferase family 9 protein n=1 Tax=Phenylobacterium aquaticum TaxID=1763816 RepID=UPI001F5D85AC|nr:glycosyltransferase family 9 protein [Phenylobacterium aquaticum]MCI3134150.1 hypothetical protein [Phenylobacterium aquaticum]
MAGAFEEAVAAHRAGDFETAERGYRAFAHHPVALHNLAVLYNAAGRFAEAEAAFRKVLKAKPDFAASEHSLAMLWLGAGRYAQGWPAYEGPPAVPGAYLPPAPDLPEWRGEDLRGKRLRVYGEQGFGDQIQLSRLFPALTQLGAEVSFVCSPILETLFAPLGITVVGGREGVALPEADCWTLIGSLPWRLDLREATIPPPTDLRVPLGAGGGTGVVVRGRPTHANDANRSLNAEDAARLLALGRDLSPEATGAMDFLETARIVAGLDRVISVDTAIAHLAATLGKPTWILLPARGVDWRWGRQGEGSVWYPTVRLFRQPAHGDWSAVLGEIEARAAD